MTTTPAQNLARTSRPEVDPIIRDWRPAQGRQTPMTDFKGCHAEVITGELCHAPLITGQFANCAHEEEEEEEEKARIRCSFDAMRQRIVLF